MKIALVCDFLTKLGGAQKVLLTLHEIYPEAPIYCLLYDEEGTRGQFKDCKIIPSGLQKLPKMIRKKPKYLLANFPQAIEQFDLSGYDIVISSNDSFAHGVLTKPRTLHLCYCHTPMRYAWDWYSEYLSENKIGFGLKGLIVRNLLHNIRIWDRASADRVDMWLANSKNVAKRIKKYYHKESVVIYPPVAVEEIKPSTAKPEDYYVVASRLEPYKRIDLAIRACNQMNKKLVVIGEGSEHDYLASISGPTIKFIGWRSGQDLFEILSEAKAFIFPGEDDFGIAPVEAMAAGRPVIAYGRGGVLESIIPGKTGILFNEQSVESLSKAIADCENNYAKFSLKECRKQAEKFSSTLFKKLIKETVETSYTQFQKEMENV